MDNGRIVVVALGKTYICYLYSMTKYVVDGTAIVMLYCPRFHGEEGLLKANVIKAT